MEEGYTYTAQTRIRELEALANIASLAATVFFREPDAPMLMAMEPCLEGIRTRAEDFEQPELQQGIRLLDDFLEEYHSCVSTADLLERLAVEYAGLFYDIGVIPVDIFESLWLGKEHTLYEDPYFEVVEVYKQWDYKKSETSTEPEDHIANELDFLAYQLKAAIVTQENSSYLDRYRMDSVREFVSNHLSRWVPSFCKRMLEATDSTYYTAAVYLTIGLLKTLNSVLALPEGEGFV